MAVIKDHIMWDHLCVSHDLQKKVHFLDSVIFQETVLFLLELENSIDKWIVSVVTDLWHAYINTGCDASLAKKNRHTWKSNMHHLWRLYLSHYVAARVQKRAYLVSALYNSPSSSSFAFFGTRQSSRFQCKYTISSHFI